MHKYYLSRSMLIFSIMLISCSFLKIIKSIEWVERRYKGDELISEIKFKFEEYDETGNLLYDSTLFKSNAGYGVSEYKNGLIIISEAHYSYGYDRIENYEYDNEDNLIKSTVISDGESSTIE